MLTKLPAQNKIAAFDIDAQNTFTPVCPDELPVAEGDQIVEELNAQAALASLRIGSRDAHSPQAVWIAGNGHPVLSPVSGYPDVDVSSAPAAEISLSSPPMAVKLLLRQQHTH